MQSKVVADHFRALLYQDRDKVPFFVVCTAMVIVTFQNFGVFDIKLELKFLYEIEVQFSIGS